jgi:uncharacterized protein (TIRG00374 family)
MLTKRAVRYVVLLILLGLAVHLILPQITTLEHSLNIIARMAWWTVGLALVTQVLRYVCLGYLIHAIVEVGGQRLPVMRGTLVAMGASSIGLIAGGAVGNAAATYKWVQSSGVSREGAALTGWLPSLFNTALLVLISSVGLIHLLLVHELSTLQAIAFGVILTVLIGGVGGLLWGVGHRAQLARWVAHVAGGWARLRRKPYESATTEASVDRFFGIWDALRAGGWHGPLLGAVLNIGFDMLTLYFVFFAAGHAVSLGVLLAGYGLSLLLGKVAFLPGGVGIVEGTMAALYDSLGVPDPVTVVVILGYRAISFWLPTVLGFLLIPYLQHVGRQSHKSGGGP